MLPGLRPAGWNGPSGRCETVERAATDIVGNNFSAALNGADEVPPADPDGVGTAYISKDDATNRICTHLEVRNIGAVTAAHIHRGSSESATLGKEKEAR